MSINFVAQTERALDLFQLFLETMPSLELDVYNYQIEEPYLTHYLSFHQGVHYFKNNPANMDGLSEELYAASGVNSENARILSYDLETAFSEADKNSLLRPYHINNYTTLVEGLVGEFKEALKNKAKEKIEINKAALRQLEQEYTTAYHAGQFIDIPLFGDLRELIRIDYETTKALRDAEIDLHFTGWSPQQPQETEHKTAMDYLGIINDRLQNEISYQVQIDPAYERVNNYPNYEKYIEIFRSRYGEGCANLLETLHLMGGWENVRVVLEQSIKALQEKQQQLRTENPILQVINSETIMSRAQNNPDGLSNKTLYFEFLQASFEEVFRAQEELRGKIDNYSVPLHKCEILVDDVLRESYYGKRDAKTVRIVANWAYLAMRTTGGSLGLLLLISVGSILAGPTVAGLLLGLAGAAIGMSDAIQNWVSVMNDELVNNAQRGGPEKFQAERETSLRKLMAFIDLVVSAIDLFLSARALTKISALPEAARFFNDYDDIVARLSDGGVQYAKVPQKHHNRIQDLIENITQMNPQRRTEALDYIDELYQRHLTNPAISTMEDHHWIRQAAIKKYTNVNNELMKHNIDLLDWEDNLSMIAGHNGRHKGTYNVLIDKPMAELNAQISEIISQGGTIDKALLENTIHGIISDAKKAVYQNYSIMNNNKLIILEPIF